jgi:hypothetical protein
MVLVKKKFPFMPVFMRDVERTGILKELKRRRYRIGREY